MRRRLLASLAATAAVATSLLISSAGPATAAAAPEASAAMRRAPASLRTAEFQTPRSTSGRPPIQDRQHPARASASRSTTARRQDHDLPRTGGRAIHPRAAYPPEFTARARSGPTSTAPGSTVTRMRCRALARPRRTSRGSSSTRRQHRASRAGTFGNVKFIQRIDTRGGLPPATMRRTDGRRGLHRELRVLGTQVTITPPNRRDGRSSVAAVRRFADLRRRKSRPPNDLASENQRLRPFATVWPIPPEPECCHPARVLRRRPS